MVYMLINFEVFSLSYTFLDVLQLKQHLFYLFSWAWPAARVISIPN